MFKLIYRNIFSKPINAIIILLSVALSVSLMYCVLSFGKTIDNFLYERYSVKGGNSDIIIESSSIKGSNLVSLDGLEDIEDIEWAIGSLSFYSTYKSSNYDMVELRGFKKSELNYLHQINFLSKSFLTLNDISEDQIIISEAFASEHNLKIDDIVAFSVFGNFYDFYIGGIAENNGYFKENSNTVLAIDSYLSSKIGWPFGYIYNQIYIKASTANIDVLYKAISADPAYQTASVEFAINAESIKKDASAYTALFDLTGAILIVLSMLIVSKLFGLQYKQKSQIVGQLKVIGTSNSKLIFIMLVECFILGLIGSIIGGTLAGYIFNALVKSTLQNTTVYFSVINILIAVGSVLAFTCLAGLSPVIDASRHSIRTNLATSKNNVFKLYPKTMLVLCVVFALLITLQLTISKTRGIFGAINIFLLLVICTIAIPFLMRFVSKILSNSKKTSIKLSSITLKNESSLMLSAQVLIIGVIVCMVLSNGLTIATQFWNKFNIYAKDKVVVANVGSFSEERLQEFKSLNGVNSVYPIMQDSAILKHQNYESNTYLCAVDGNDIENIYSLDFLTDINAIKSAFSNTEKNYIVLTGLYKYIKGYNIGDKITINYKGIDVEYEIAGFCHTLYKYGDMAFVNRTTFISNFNTINYNTLFIETNDTIKVVDSLHDNFKNEGISIVLMSALIKLNTKTALNIVNFYTRLLIFITLMVLFAIICNISAAKFSRQKEFSQYMLLGMTNKKLLQQNIIESLATGIPALIFGLAGGALMMKLILDSAILINYYHPYNFNIINAIRISLLFLIVYTLNPIILWLFKKYQVNISIYKNLK